MSTEELYNSQIYNTYIQMIRKDYPNINIEDLLKYANMTEEEIIDKGKWFTQESANRFNEKIYEMTGDIDIPKKAGQFAAQSSVTGFLRPIICSFANPDVAYKRINTYPQKELNRAYTFQATKQKNNTWEIIAKPNEGTNVQPFQCQNAIGNFEAIPTLFGYEPAKVIHTDNDCLFKDNPEKQCRYEISWKKKEIKNDTFVIFTGILIFIILTAFFLPSKNLQWLVLGGAILLFAIFYKNTNENQSIINEIKNDYQRLWEDKNILEDILLLSTGIAELISKKNDSKDIFYSTLNLLCNKMKFEQGAILIITENGSTLNLLASCPKESFSSISSSDFNLSKIASEHVFWKNLNKGKAIYDNKKTIDSNYKTIPYDPCTNTPLLGVPIIFQRKNIGFLLLTGSRKNITQRDVDLSSAIASQLAIIYNQYRTEIEQKRRVERSVHDIKTPINIIQTRLDLIKQSNSLSTKNKKNIKSIEKQIDRIRSMTHQINRFLRAYNPTELKDIDLVIFVQSVIDKFVRKNRFTEIEHVGCNENEKLINDNYEKIGRINIFIVSQSCLDKVMIDTDGMEWAFMELFTNAQKNYATNVEITIEKLQNLTKLTIQDNGRGIDEKVKNTIFEPYVYASKYGSGLGITNAKEIIEKNQGSIKLDDSYRQGAKFIITFKRKEGI